MLPILALDVQPFQSVLDMCSAPGGKALNIFDFCPYGKKTPRFPFYDYLYFALLYVVQLT